ncbi:MAG TPA: M67 family metallopeptidase [Anaerolineales bacterium]|nr:M67 family metallopeptidase [Anaerolineales bacterium]
MGEPVKSSAYPRGAWPSNPSSPRQYNHAPMSPERLRIPPKGWTAIVAHVESCLPEEACGFLGGTGEDVSVILPIENMLHSEVRFQMAPEAQLRGMTWLEREGLLMLAIYHSHPNGPSGLSGTDLKEAAYPESALLVVSSSDGGWVGRAFMVEGGPVREIEVRVGDDAVGSPSREPV